MENKTYKRRNYFIDKKFQGKFIVQFSFLVLFGGMLTVMLLYLLGTQSKTVAIQDSRVIAKTTADFILPLILRTVIFVTLVVGVTAGILTLLMSHKLSGPFYRFKKVIQTLKSGDFSSEFNIRSTDQFQGLADELNSMIHNTAREITRLKNSVVMLSQKLNSLNENDFPENKRQDFAELKKIAGELDKAAHYFKT